MTFVAISLYYLNGVLAKMVKGVIQIQQYNTLMTNCGIVASTAVLRFKGEVEHDRVRMCH